MQSYTKHSVRAQGMEKALRELIVPRPESEERATSKCAGVTELKWQRTEEEQIVLRAHEMTLSSGLAVILRLEFYKEV